MRLRFALAALTLLSVETSAFALPARVAEMPAARPALEGKPDVPRAGVATQRRVESPTPKVTRGAPKGSALTAVGEGGAFVKLPRKLQEAIQETMAQLQSRGRPATDAAVPQSTKDAADTLVLRASVLEDPKYAGRITPAIVKLAADAYREAAAIATRGPSSEGAPTLYDPTSPFNTFTYASRLCNRSAAAFDKLADLRQSQDDGKGAQAARDDATQVRSAAAFYASTAKEIAPLPTLTPKQAHAQWLSGTRMPQHRRVEVDGYGQVHHFDAFGQVRPPTYQERMAEEAAAALKAGPPRPKVIPGIVDVSADTAQGVVFPVRVPVNDLATGKADGIHLVFEVAGSHLRVEYVDADSVRDAVNLPSPPTTPDGRWAYGLAPLIERNQRIENFRHYYGTVTRARSWLEGTIGPDGRFSLQPKNEAPYQPGRWTHEGAAISEPRSSSGMTLAGRITKTGSVELRAFERVVVKAPGHNKHPDQFEVIHGVLDGQAEVESRDEILGYDNGVKLGPRAYNDESNALHNANVLSPKLGEHATLADSSETLAGDLAKVGPAPAIKVPAAKQAASQTSKAREAQL